MVRLRCVVVTTVAATIDTIRSVVPATESTPVTETATTAGLPVHVRMVVLQPTPANPVHKLTVTSVLPTHIVA